MLGRVLSLFVLTGGEVRGEALAEHVVLLGVQGGSVLSVGEQVLQGVPGGSPRDPLLDGAGALNAQEKAETSNDGPRRLPDDQRTVGSNVGETHVCRSIGLCRDKMTQHVKEEHLR